MNKLTAVVIDDAFRPPSAGEFGTYADSFQDVLIKNSSVAEWFVGEFPTDADVESQGFLDDFLGNEEAVARFWRIRNQSPLGEELGQRAFSGLEVRVRGDVAPLLEIVSALETMGYEVRTFGALPPGQAEREYIKNVNLIVIDHFLGAPSEGDNVVIPTLEFFGHLFSDAWKEDPPLTPYFLLVSTVDIASNDRASQFRERLKVSESMFRFAQKSATLGKSPLSALKAFHEERDVLVEYSRFHAKYRQTLAKTFSDVGDTIAKLEVMDLAAINVGQLQGEKESLSSYLNWLVGQYFTNKLEADLAAFDASRKLPSTIESSLVGHLGPSNKLSGMFSRISLNMPASQAHLRSEGVPVQIRFGDVFKVGNIGSSGTADGVSLLKPPVQARSKAASRLSSLRNKGRLVSPFKKLKHQDSIGFRCILLISQTCDVIHRKLKNDQVLFVEGTALEVPQGDESRMFWETAKQIGLLAQNGLLIRHEGKHYKLSWDVSDVRTIDRSLIERDMNNRYLGRLNELFALQIQRASLDHLGRIGLPIKPAQTLAFTSCMISASFGGQTVFRKKESLCWVVLRIEKGTHIKVSGAFTQPFVDWVPGALQELKTEANLHPSLLKKITEVEASLQPHAHASQWVVQQEEVKKTAEVHTTEIKLGLKDASGQSKKFPGTVRLDFEGFKTPAIADAKAATVTFAFSKEQISEHEDRREH
jgi:hypothetical protein